MSAICPNPFCKNPDIDPFTAHGCFDAWTPPSTNSSSNSATCGSPSCSSVDCSSSRGSCSWPSPFPTSGPSDSERESA